jgi:hypothetical protein
MLFLNSLNFCHRVPGYLKNASYSVEVFWEIISEEEESCCAYCRAAVKAQKPKIISISPNAKPSNVSEQELYSRCRNILVPCVRVHTACSNCSSIQEQNINNYLTRI